jgi:predicted HTH transcriptional regulator
MRSPDSLPTLVRELCKLPHETEWVEFKIGNDNPQEIGEYISALANTATLLGKPRAYLVWGIHNEDHRIVGTRFDPTTTRKGNEELESWLLRLLDPHVEVHFERAEVDGEAIVVLEIASSAQRPVRFAGVEYIRIGTYKKPLKDFPEKERALWRVFDRVPFERGIAAAQIPAEAVLRLLDCPRYFELLEQPLPDGHEAIFDALMREHLIEKNLAGGWDITQLGALLFARKLESFPSLKRKDVRVIQYKGRGRTETLREQSQGMGYACGFEELVRLIQGLVPSREVIGHALRQDKPMFPPLALRELLANALIHQDFSVTGAGPMVEIFEGRIEITNPGEPLVATDRFLDGPPASRNEALAALLRRFRICEERGSGIDKVMAQLELFQLPPPLFEVPPGFTRIVLFGPRPLTELEKDMRIQVCYWHACLRYVQREPVTNRSIRERFGIEEKNRAMASRLLRDALEAGVIAAQDPTASPKQTQYVPWWAKGTQRGSGS